MAKVSRPSRISANPLVEDRFARRSSVPPRDGESRFRLRFSTGVSYLFLHLFFLPEGLGSNESVESTVGMSTRLEQIVLAGPELEVIPLEDTRSPLVVRLAGVYPHGTDFRYDIEVFGLEPGEFDVMDYVRRKDGTRPDDLPPLFVKIVSVLPPGQVEPNQLEPRAGFRIGGYRSALILGGCLWVLGLVAILLIGKKKRAVESYDSTRRISLADRLRPMVESAIAGRLGPSRLAELERLLLAYWRRRLGLEQTSAAEAIRALRNHEEAGRILTQLELWLHRPGSGSEVDVAELLKPYEDLPDDALEGPSESEESESEAVLAHRGAPEITTTEADASRGGGA